MKVFSLWETHDETVPHYQIFMESSLHVIFVKILHWIASNLFHLQATTDKQKIDTLESLQELTEDTARNGIGDVEAVSEVLSSMGITESETETGDARNEVIGQEMAESVLMTVSNLVQSDLAIPDDQTETQSASSIGDRSHILLILMTIFL